MVTHLQCGVTSPKLLESVIGEVICSSSWWIMLSSCGYLSIWVRALAWTNLWPVWWRLVLTWVLLLVPSWLALPVTSPRIGQACRWGRQFDVIPATFWANMFETAKPVLRKSEMFRMDFRMSKNVFSGTCGVSIIIFHQLQYGWSVQLVDQESCGK